MTYLGNSPTTQSFISGTDYFNGDGSTVAFTLSRTVVSPNDVEAVINNVVQQPNSAYTISGTTITFTSAPSAGTSNIYVRYLSTTTQSITPSQNTVSYSTLNSDTQSKLGIMYKNRIINGAMVIDQRNAGASVTPTSSGYTLDRFRLNISQASKLSYQQTTTAPVGFANSTKLTSLSSYSVGASDYFIFGQKIEGYNTADLNWGTANAKTVTISAWVYSSLIGTFTASILNGNTNRSYPFNYTISAANTWTQISVTVAGDTSGTWATTTDTGIFLVFSMGIGSNYQGTANTWAGAEYYGTSSGTSVVGTNGATWYITGVQLEVGTQATTFTNAGGSYGGELALCQRYYVRFGSPFNTIAGGARLATGTCTTASACAIPIYLPVSLRSAPTVGYSGINIANASNDTALTSVSGVIQLNNLITADHNTGGGMSGLGQIKATGSTAYIDYSSEL